MLGQLPLVLRLRLATSTDLLHFSIMLSAGGKVDFQQLTCGLMYCNTSGIHFSLSMSWLWNVA